MILSDSSMCMIPHQGIGSPLSSLFLIRLFSGAQDRGWRENILVLHILQSQKQDPMKKTSHTIRSRCACVWNFCGWNTHSPFAELSLLSFAEIWAVFHFSFFFFSSHAFWGTNIYIFSSFFYIAQIFLHDEYKEFCQKRNGAFFGWKAYACVTSSVEVNILVVEYMECTWSWS